MDIKEGLSQFTTILLSWCWRCGGDAAGPWTHQVLSKSDCNNWDVEVNDVKTRWIRLIFILIFNVLDFLTPSFKTVQFGRQITKQIFFWICSRKPIGCERVTERLPLDSANELQTFLVWIGGNWVETIVHLGNSRGPHKMTLRATFGLWASSLTHRYMWYRASTIRPQEDKHTRTVAASIDPGR